MVLTTALGAAVLVYEIPLSLHVKLLRLQETGTFHRVGGVETLRAVFA